MTPADRLAAYRSRHRIEPEPDGQGYRCQVDGLRLVRTARRWWHDIPDARALTASVAIDPHGRPLADYLPSEAIRGSLFEEK